MVLESTIPIRHIRIFPPLFLLLELIYLLCYEIICPLQICIHDYGVLSSLILMLQSKD